MLPAPPGSTNSIRPKYGNVSSAGATICTTWPLELVAESCAIVRCTSAIGLHKAERTTPAPVCERGRGEGRRQAGARRRIMQHGLRHLLDHVAARGRAHESRDADALAAFDQHLGEREADHKGAFELGALR